MNEIATTLLDRWVRVRHSNIYGRVRAAYLKDNEMHVTVEDDQNGALYEIRAANCSTKMVEV